MIEASDNPTDPVQIMMLEQVAFAHFRIARLQMRVEEAKAIEIVKLYNSAATGLLGEFRRLALAVRAHRGQMPDGSSQSKFKLHKRAV